METNKETDKTVKLPWYLNMPVLIILFFIFPPVSSIISAILFVKRWRMSDSKNKKKVIGVFAIICSLFIIFIVYAISTTVSFNKRLAEINTAIENHDYITAQRLIDEEYQDEYVSYSIVSAKAKMYEQQGLYDEAANTILEHLEKSSDKSNISDSTVSRLETYKASCNDGTVSRIEALLEARKTAIEQKAAEEQAKAEKAAAEERAKAEKAAAKEQAKAEKAAAKEQAKAEKAAAKEQAKAEKAAAKEQAKAEKAAAKEQAKAEKAAVKEQAKTEKPTVTEAPVTPKPTPEAVSTAITSEQDAINAVKKYAKKQGYSETYDKFNATKENDSYFVMAGFSYLGDSWEGSADMFDVNISDGTVTLHGMADDVLAEKAGEYEAQTVQSYTFNNYYAYDLKMTDRGIFFGKHVTGYVQNNTNQTSTIVVFFRFYDENNIQIGAESTAIVKLSPGTTAKLSVYGPSDSHRFDIADIQ